jgi:hypothetical protein
MATLSITLTAMQKAAVHATPNGQIDVTTTKVSSNPAVVAVQGVPAPNDFWLIAQAPGTATVTTSTTVYGAPLSDTINVTVLPAGATTLGTVIDAPVTK